MSQSKNSNNNSNNDNNKNSDNNNDNDQSIMARVIYGTAGAAVGIYQTLYFNRLL